MIKKVVFVERSGEGGGWKAGSQDRGGSSSSGGSGAWTDRRMSFGRCCKNPALCLE